MFTIEDYRRYKETFKREYFSLQEESAKYKYEKKNRYDKVFRRALDNKKDAAFIVNTLLELKEESNIKAEDIEICNTSYVTINLNNLELDILYKVKGERVFLHIEHQTKVDYTMPMRILKYQVSVLDSIIKQEKEKIGRKDYLYPKIISIVLYTGKRKWNAKQEMEKEKTKLIEEEKEELSRYKVLEVRKIKDEELLKSKTAIGIIIMMEKSKDEEEMKNKLEKIGEEIRNYTEEEIKELWISLRAIVETKEEKELIDELFKKEIWKERKSMEVLEMIETRGWMKGREEEIC